MKFTASFLLIIFLTIGANGQGNSPAVHSPTVTRQTFTNPLLPAGADPWSIYKDGYYYYMHTTGNNLTIWKSRSLAELKNAEKKVVWTPPPSGPYSKDIWAPEVHYLWGKWYIYFAADAGTNQTHRLWVLENSSADPLQGEWVMPKVVDGAFPLRHMISGPIRKRTARCTAAGSEAKRTRCQSRRAATCC